MQRTQHVLAGDRRCAYRVTPVDQADTAADGARVTSAAMADFLLGGQVDPATHQRTEALTTVASGDFTTHGVIVGMTGSGKTGLGVVLVEEASTPASRRC